MQTPWHELLANLAIVAIFTTMWTLSQPSLSGWSPRARALGLGLMFGIGSVAAMLMPFELRAGVMIDLRATLIAVAGFAGGPLAVVVTTAIAMVARYSFGGHGVWIGLFGISIAAAIGLIAHVFFRNRIPRLAELVGFAALVAIGGILNFFLTPVASWPVLMPTVAAPLVVLLFASTLVASFVFAQERRREEATKANLMYRAIFEALPDCLNAKDISGRFLAANPATAVLMGAASPEALLGRTDFDFYPDETAQIFRQDELKVYDAGIAVAVEQRFARIEGDPTTWLSTLKTPMRDATGALIGMITHNRDISDQKRLEMELSESQSRLGAALKHMADALVMFDRDGRIVFSNAQYLELFPLTADVRVPGTHIRDIIRTAIERGEEVGVSKAETEAFVERIWSSFGTTGERQVSLAGDRWLDARTRPTADGGCLIVFSDITKIKRVESELMALNQQLEELANTDSLTALLNRRAFDRMLEQEFSRAVRDQAELSLLLIDLDNFKAYNDTYGHQQGDECLRLVSRCLKDVVRRSTDVAARYGGEELVAILPSTAEEGALTIAESFRRAVVELAIPHTGSARGVVTVSIGVAALTEQNRPGRDAMELLHRADEALYAAKAAGRDRVQGGRSERHVKMLKR
jgi:diguanylate cyclase (GGDEF)-like protein/PAS domain S-box-containing protein